MNPAFSLTRVRHDTQHRVSENAHSSVTRYVYNDENAWLYATAAPIHTPFACSKAHLENGAEQARCMGHASRTLTALRVLYGASAGFIAVVSAFGC